MSKSVVKVGQLVRFLKVKVDEDAMLQRLLVSGEISNFVTHRSGHWYFTLKDETARMNCVMFRSYAGQVVFPVKEGDKVLVQANTTIFEATGQLQLMVTAMKPDGVGELYLRFEALKKKLQAEGLFDPMRKKPIVRYPFKIGVICGKNTAARQDILTTLKRRWPIAEIVELHPLVQGEMAAEQIGQALRYMDTLDCDTILLARGGGSLEDLWPFNDEQLAYTLSQMKTPVITGVGHEVDFTIVDFVSDLRAATPTAAAELCCPELKEVRLQLFTRQQQLKNSVEAKRLEQRRHLAQLKGRPCFTQPLTLIEQKEMLLNYRAEQLLKVRQRLSLSRQHLSNAQHRLIQVAHVQTGQLERHLFSARQQLETDMKQQLQQQRYRMQLLISTLDERSPLKIMKKGYALTKVNGQLIISTDQVRLNDTLDLTYLDGMVCAQVIAKEKKQ